MEIRTITGATIVQVPGTFENAYDVALGIWNNLAGIYHCDGLQIYDELSDNVLFTINYVTHER